MKLTDDYAERVYAGVLGKIIGVYAGRPFEGWSHEEIIGRLGEIKYYVNEKVGEYNRAVRGISYTPPLIVTDDDIAGTFTFLRALPDYHNDRNISPEKIGQTWLNYIVENRTVFWWGGMGNSTEHTAYLRLKQGLKAPLSGSASTNGSVVAEQIGSQIFIDGWAMVAPGDPAYAADLARKAASVSHDGEAIYGAQVIAAMEAAAFVEKDIQVLLDIGSSFIPKDCLIRRVIADVREWHSELSDWKRAFIRIKEKYGYDKFPGNVHIVPNHALVILGLLYGDDDFGKSMLVVNTAGWDTDCNAGNVGCLMGIKNGLAGLESNPSWREPVADRILLSTANGGGAISDAVIEATRIIDIGRSLAGSGPYAPKGGARFHFEFPGSVQGFAAVSANTSVENVSGFSRTGTRSLAMRFLECGIIQTPAFILPEEMEMAGYQFLASPTLYPGQTVRAMVQADTDVSARVCVRSYSCDGNTQFRYGDEVVIASGEPRELTYQVPDMGGWPIISVGVEGRSSAAASLYVDYLTWDGSPTVSFGRPNILADVAMPKNGESWRRAWVQGVDQWDPHWKQAYRLAQNRGRGLLIQGTREWHDYEAESTIRISLAKAAGIAVHVQGMERYYAFLIAQEGFLRLIKKLDGETVLAEIPFSFENERPYAFRLRTHGSRLLAWLDGTKVFDVEDDIEPLADGGVAYVVEEGHIMSESMTVQGVKSGAGEH